MNKVQRVTISVIKHMTEDEYLVKSSLLNAIPPMLRSSVNVFSTKTKGHYNNDIQIFTATFEKNEAEEVSDYIFKNLDELSLTILKHTLEYRVEEGKTLHLRLDKHLLLSNKFVLSDSDEIVKIVIKFTNSKFLLEEISRWFDARAKNG